MLSRCASPATRDSDGKYRRVDNFLIRPLSVPISRQEVNTRDGQTCLLPEKEMEAKALDNRTRNLLVATDVDKPHQHSWLKNNRTVRNEVEE